MTARFPDLARYDRVSIDTETTGLGYRDRPVGLSWATPDGQSSYLAWGHEVGGTDGLFDGPSEANNCSLEQVRNWADAELRDDLLCVYHNAPFDLRMQAYVGIRRPARVEDTMVAAPLLNELEPAFSLNALAKKYLGREKSDDELNRWCAERFGGRPTRRDQAKNYWRAPASIVGPYACGDTELALALHEHLRPLVTAQGLDPIYALETAVIPIVVDMHLTGVRVDLDAAHALDRSLTAEIDALRTEWDRLAGGADPGKTREIVDVFKRYGLATAVTPKGNPSIQSEDLAHIAHPVAQTLLKWRKLTKHRDLFVRTYVLANADETGVVHGEFHALRSDDFGAVSGRFSSGLSDGSLNLQNLPSRDEELAAAIRGLFVPYHKGWRWVKADYSQIQFRLLAHYAALIGYPALARTYHDRPEWSLDPETGEVDFHRVAAGITKIPRKDAKHINFGFVFGMGKDKLARKLGLSPEAAQAVFDEYHGKLPAVRATYDKLSQRANAKGQIRTLGGRVRRFPTAEEARRRGWRVHKNERHVGCHKALNALLQGGEADIVKRALVELRPVAKEYGAILHLTVHDEFDYSAPPETVVAFTRRLREVMEDVKLEVPVTADVSVGTDWGHADEDVGTVAVAA